MKFISHYYIRRIKYLLPLLFLLTATLPVQAANPAVNVQSQRRLLTVGYSEVTGLSETGPDGKPHGLIIDYLNEISKYTNWDYEYIKSDSLFDDFLAGKFDLIGGNYYMPELEQYFAYPKYSMGNSLSALFCRKDDADIKSYELTSLNGKTIGIYEKATENIRRLKVFLESNHLDCELKYYTYEQHSKVDNLYEYLANGEVDLLLGNANEENHDFRLAATYIGQPYYIVTRVGEQDIVDGLNMALEQILDSNPRFHDTQYEANFSNWFSSIHLSQDELAYIKEKQTVSVAIVKDMHPFSCAKSADTQHSGLVFDMLESISAFSGLAFTYVSADTYEDALQLLQNGEADLLSCYLDSDTVQASDDIVLSSPYITLNNILTKNKSVNYPSDTAVIGLQTGRSLPADITVGQIRYFATVEEGLLAVNSGKIDLYYGLTSSIERELQRHRLSNVVPLALINQDTRISFAMNRPADAELLTILNKAISSLSQDELNAIINHNMTSIGYSELSLSELIYANPVAFVAIFSLIILLLASLFFLHQRSRIRTSLMQAELEKTELKTKAKSAFLSRMSHEIRTPMNAIVGLAHLTCAEENLPPVVESNLKKLLSSAQYLLSLINDILDMSRIENDHFEILSQDFSLQQLLEELDDMVRVQAQQKQLHFTMRCQIKHYFLVGDAIRLRQVLLNLLSNSIKFTPPEGHVCLRVKELSATQDSAEYLFSVSDTGIGIAPEYQQQIFVPFEQIGNNTSKTAGTGLGLPISRSIVEAMGGTLQLNSSPGENSEFYFRLHFPFASNANFNTVSAAPLDLTGVRILLAEDNDLNAEITQELLAALGTESDRAVNGQEAVDRFITSAPDYYDLILMDIRMPVMDGLQACREIRSSNHPCAVSIPIIALTANSFQEDSDTARLSGMNGFVPKPIDLDYFKEVLGEYLSK